MWTTVRKAKQLLLPFRVWWKPTGVHPIMQEPGPIDLEFYWQEEHWFRALSAEQPETNDG